MSEVGCPELEENPKWQDDDEWFAKLGESEIEARFLAFIGERAMR